MWKEAFIKALAPMSLMVLFLIVGLAPLYLIGGMMTRQMQEKVN
jgi:hypothetical protein|tara:strand:- start:2397 stop:2528 length:132 start_codon:yes stop_codon:yes gene_type:complete